MALYKIRRHPSRVESHKRQESRGQGFKGKTKTRNPELATFCSHFKSSREEGSLQPEIHTAVFDLVLFLRSKRLRLDNKQPIGFHPGFDKSISHPRRSLSGQGPQIALIDYHVGKHELFHLRIGKIFDKTDEVFRLRELFLFVSQLEVFGIFG
jgi:hypothetical protein